MNWKKALYYLPGVGLATHTIKEYKIRKGKNPWYNLKESKDKKALAIYLLETVYLAFAISSKVAIGYYVHQGMSTGDWNPLKYVKEKIIEKKEQDLKKGNELEKTIRYEDILKIIG